MEKITAENQLQPDWQEFDKYCGEARNAYVNFINSLVWRTDLRTHAESILICFDQMRDRLASQQPVQNVWEMPPYIIEHIGLDFYNYPHIRGGSGNPKDKPPQSRYGGEFDYIFFYASPEKMEQKPVGMCERLWSIEYGIVYGEGRTIPEAYQDYIKWAQTIPNQ